MARARGKYYRRSKEQGTFAATPKLAVYHDIDQGGRMKEIAAQTRYGSLAPSWLRRRRSRMIAIVWGGRGMLKGDASGSAP